MSDEAGSTAKWDVAYLQSPGHNLVSDAANGSRRSAETPSRRF
jgi:hypothetical protein